jgi:hypothetical protein
MHMRLPGFSGEASLNTYFRPHRIKQGQVVPSMEIGPIIDCDCGPLIRSCCCCVLDQCCCADDWGTSCYPFDNISTYRAAALRAAALHSLRSRLPNR